LEKLVNPDPERVQNLFLRIVKLPEKDRQRTLEAECDGDLALQRRVNALLLANDAPDSFMDFSLNMESLGSQNKQYEMIDETLDTGEQGEPAETSASPFAIEEGVLVAGRYRLERKIGEGGMGEVWIAKQTEPVKRKVALKLIKKGMDSAAVIARFEQERQALALMDHPNVCRVLDGGIMPSGQPFFIMDLVNGLPLAKFCDESRMTLKERLKLFVPICQAIQHAHQKGVVHRDLKPANILVTLVDGTPVPRVIDFGVAKAIHGKLTEETLSTQFGAVVGTLEYMAPEQAGYSGSDIDTRADIYSLGVVLYELLTGLRPIDAKRLREAGFAEMIRVIQEEELSKPSTRLSTDEALPSLAALRQTEPRKLTSLLKGELDWIVLRCLEKKRDRRYESANGLARDIQRYLADETVEARPPSFGYLTGKFLRRNKGVAIGAGLVFVSLLAGVVGTSLGLIKANQQTELAQSEATAAEIARKEEAAQRLLADEANRNAQNRLKQIEKGSTLLGTIFRDLNLTNIEGEGKTLEIVLGERLKEAAAKLDQEEVGDPLVVAKLQGILGESLISLGYANEAIELLKKAAVTNAKLLGATHATTLTDQHNLAEAYSLAGEYKSAVKIHKETLEATRATLGEEHRDTIASIKDLGNAHVANQDYQAGIPLLEEALRLCRAHLDEEDNLTLYAMNSLAVGYSYSGKPGQALPFYEQTLKLRRKLMGPKHYDTLTAMNNLASTYFGLKRIDEALPLMKEVYELRKSKLGAEHPHTILSMANLAVVLEAAGKRKEARPYFEEAVKISESKNGLYHPGTLLRIRNLANCCRDLGDKESALKLYQRYVDRHAIKDGKESLSYANALIYLGFNQLKYEMWEEAEPVLRQCLELRIKHLGDDDWRVGGAQSLLGGTLLKLKKFEQAEPLLISGFEIQKAKESEMLGNAVDAIDQALDRIVDFYKTRNQKGDEELVKQWESKKKKQ